MRRLPVVVPSGEYVLEQRRVRFRCEAPWPVPGSRIVLEVAHELYGLLVHVDDLGGTGWIAGTVKGKAHGKQLSRLRAMSGSRSSSGADTTDD